MISVTVPAGQSSASVLTRDVDAGTSCTITELAPLPPAGSGTTDGVAWTAAWTGSVFTPSDPGGTSFTAIVTADQITDVTVTNGRTVRTNVSTGRIRITKVITSAFGWPGGTFRFSVSCVPGVISLNVAAGESSGSVLTPEVPAGTSCTVTELGPACGWFGGHDWVHVDRFLDGRSPTARRTRVARASRR